MMNGAFLLERGETRTKRALNIFGDLVSVLLSGADTSGGFCVMTVQTAPKSGPPLHRHNREDEFFHVLEGEYLFEVDGEHIYAGPGCSVYAPKTSVHTFQNVGSAPGRMMVIAEPAGMDEFFGELAEAKDSTGAPDMSAIGRAFERHGLELMGPPLAARGSNAAA